jgi:hypothetical protein
LPRRRATQGVAHPGVTSQRDPRRVDVALPTPIGIDPRQTLRGRVRLIRGTNPIPTRVRTEQRIQIGLAARTQLLQQPPVEVISVEHRDPVPVTHPGLVSEQRLLVLRAQRRPQGSELHRVRRQPPGTVHNRPHLGAQPRSGNHRCRGRLRDGSHRHPDSPRPPGVGRRHRVQGRGERGGPLARGGVQQRLIPSTVQSRPRWDSRSGDRAVVGDREAVGHRTHRDVHRAGPGTGELTRRVGEHIGQRHHRRRHLTARSCRALRSSRRRRRGLPHPTLVRVGAGSHHRPNLIVEGRCGGNQPARRRIKRGRIPRPQQRK